MVVYGGGCCGFGCVVASVVNCRCRCFFFSLSLSFSMWLFAFLLHLFFFRFHSVVPFFIPLKRIRFELFLV